MTNIYQSYFEVIAKLIFPMLIYNFYFLVIQLVNNTKNISKHYLIYPLI